MSDALLFREKKVEVPLLEDIVIVSSVSLDWVCLIISSLFDTIDLCLKQLS